MRILSVISILLFSGSLAFASGRGESQADRDARAQNDRMNNAVAATQFKSCGNCTLGNYAPSTSPRPKPRPAGLNSNGGGNQKSTQNNTNKGLNKQGGHS